jgi:hypothetical protein
LPAIIRLKTVIIARKKADEIKSFDPIIFNLLSFKEKAKRRIAKGNRIAIGKYINRKKKGRQNKIPKPSVLSRPMLSFLLIISIVTATPNRTKHKLIASVEDHDMKKRYCTHPAIRVTILFNAGGRPAFFPNNLITITKRIAATIS